MRGLQFELLLYFQFLGLQDFGLNFGLLNFRLALVAFEQIPTQTKLRDGIALIAKRVAKALKTSVTTHKNTWQFTRFFLQHNGGFGDFNGAVELKQQPAKPPSPQRGSFFYAHSSVKSCF